MFLTFLMDVASDVCHCKMGWGTPLNKKSRRAIPAAKPRELNCEDESIKAAKVYHIEHLMSIGYRRKCRG
jgi:hypothetical protein